MALTVKHKDNVESALKRLPDAFSSATNSNPKSRNGKFRDVDKTDQITLKDITSSGKFRARSHFNGTWISDEEFVYASYRKGLNVVNVRDASKNRNVMSRGHFDHYNPYKYFVSADQKYLMLQIDPYPVFRRSTLSEYVIRAMRPSGKVEIKLRPSDHNEERDGPFLIRYASFAPAGNAVVYVDEDNNIYYRRSVMDRDEKLTTTGKDAVFFNGIPDWVFEEEVFEDNKAMWWGPDGNTLVFGSFNDTEVGNVLLKAYGDWKDIEQYPIIEEVPYPKVNTTNPVNQLWVADLANGTISKRQIPPPLSMANEETHFFGVHFADASRFAVKWMNRVQDRTVVTMCSINSIKDCEEIFAYEEPEGWVNYKYQLHFDHAEGSSDFVTVFSDPHSVHRYRQVLLVSNNQRTFLTKRDADVVKILEWSSDGYIYFVATAEGQPGTRHLYRVPSPNSAASGDESNKLECMTCQTGDHDLHRRECKYYDVSMSKDAGHYSMTCKGPDVPYTCICETATNKMISTWEDNDKLIKRLSGRDLPSVHMLDIPVNGTDLPLRAKMYLPPDFEPTSKYPMIVYAYGGPGSQMADETFDQSSFQTYLAGSKGFIYVTVDPRGTGYQGDRFQFAMKKSFGTVDVASVTAAAAYLQRNLTYVDADRTAIWGWSYGGFLSLSTLGQDEDNVFACAASVAPVSDWTLYDTYYTERYMGLLSDNAKGYDRSRVFNNLDRLKYKPFFLLHGTHDDNVHYQQSMLLSAALEKKDILFRQQSYPDQDHSIISYQTHLYHSITDFFLNDCFTERKTKK